MKEYICTLHNTHSVSETILVLFLRGKVRKFFYFEIYDVEVNYIICHSSEYKLWHVKYIWCGLNSNSYFKKEKIERKNVNIKYVNEFKQKGFCKLKVFFPVCIYLSLKVLRDTGWKRENGKLE